ncbi:hypothetical protein CCP4SC76_7220001 [Gammaproteobacteria bacterium]
MLHEKVRAHQLHQVQLAAHLKGRVEKGVGYVKNNLLNGLELPDFTALNPATQVWLETVANVRIHGETHRRPEEHWLEERPFLQAVNPRPFDVGRVLDMRANRQYRVALDSNRYSVPARYAGQPVTMKAYPDRVCVYHEAELIARHTRSFERHQDVDEPDHSKALIAQRHHAQDSQILKRFLGLTPLAVKYHNGLLERRGNAMIHIRKIVALADIHGDNAVVRALTDALTFETHLIDARSRQLPEPSPLQLMRRQDLLELELPPADLSVYPDVLTHTDPNT